MASEISVGQPEGALEEAHFRAVRLGENGEQGQSCSLVNRVVEGRDTAPDVLVGGHGSPRQEPVLTADSDEAECDKCNPGRDKDERIDWLGETCCRTHRQPTYDGEREAPGAHLGIPATNPEDGQANTQDSSGTDAHDHRDGQKHKRADDRQEDVAVAAEADTSTPPSHPHHNQERKEGQRRSKRHDVGVDIEHRRHTEKNRRGTKDDEGQGPRASLGTHTRPSLSDASQQIDVHEITLYQRAIWVKSLTLPTSTSRS